MDDIKQIIVEVIKYECKDGSIFARYEDALTYSKKLNGLIKPCDNCGGSGQDSTWFSNGECPSCKGKGHVEKQTNWE